MGLNTGYLKAERTKESDENYTPFYTVDPIMKYIKEGTKVWLPFDCEWSAFYQSFSAQGGEIHSYKIGHIGRTGFFYIRAAGV